MDDRMKEICLGLAVDVHANTAEASEKRTVSQNLPEQGKQIVKVAEIFEMFMKKETS